VRLTLRHFRRFRVSTLGGWIATRAGGHYAVPHIDDFVESMPGDATGGCRRGVCLVPVGLAPIAGLG
jgi:alkyldihydroxyacetonephosphate synthase